jgi:translation initiation factor 5B
MSVDFDQHFQTTANYLVSLLSVFEVEFPGGIDNSNVKWRALIWAISEAFLFLSIAINYLPRTILTEVCFLTDSALTARWYSRIFKFALFIIMLDFLLCVIWLPIGVSKTYGFRGTKEAFLTTCSFPLYAFSPKIDGN